MPGSTSIRAQTEAEAEGTRLPHSELRDSALAAGRSDSREGWLSLRSTPVLSPSPVADAVDIPPIEIDAKAAVEGDAAKNSIGLIKIGQTSLHNPKGRSSWIGL